MLIPWRVILEPVPALFFPSSFFSSAASEWAVRFGGDMDGALMCVISQETFGLHTL